MLGNYLLYQAIHEESTYHRAKLLKQWINQSQNTGEGFTALHYASFYGNLQSIKYLIQHGADINVTNMTRINVMHVAA